MSTYKKEKRKNEISIHINFVSCEFEEIKKMYTPTYYRNASYNLIYFTIIIFCFCLQVSVISHIKRTIKNTRPSVLSRVITNLRLSRVQKKILKILFLDDEGGKLARKKYSLVFAENGRFLREDPGPGRTNKEAEFRTIPRRWILLEVNDGF